MIFLGDNLVFAGVAQQPYGQVDAGIGSLFLILFMLAGNPAPSCFFGQTEFAWLSVGAFGSAAQVWTVIFEWWIYIAFGIGYFTIVNRKPSAIATKLLFVALALVSASVILGALINTTGLIVAWALGMGARLMRRRLLSLDQRLCAGTAIISAAIAVMLLANDNFDFYAPITTIIIGIAFFATYFGIPDFSILARSGILRAAVDFMSKISYSLYLVHLSVILWMIHEFPEMVGKPAAVGAFLLISNLLAFLCYLAFEQHYPKVRAMIDSLILHRAENSLKKVT